jgi:DNA-binding MarR family transcriptional regulator
VADRDQLITHIMATQAAMRDVMAGAKHPLLDLNLTMPQLKVTLVLYRQGPLAAQDLAARIDTSPATLSGIVDRLVAQGLVARGEDPSDRRVRKLELTDEGQEQIDRVIRAGQAEQQKLFLRLEDRGLAIVAEAFDLILAAAKEMRAEQE